MAGGAPGPGGTRVPAGGKVIYVEQDLTAEEEERLRIEAEVSAGLRCGGCRERVLQGYEFVFITPKKINGRTFANWENVVACSPKNETGCTFAAACTADAVGVRVVDQKFVDAPGLREKTKGGGE